MKLRIAWVGKSKTGRTEAAAIASLTAEYLKRASRYSPCEGTEYATEAALLRSLDKGGRTAPFFVALDSRGKQLSSEELAELLRQHQERGTQEMVFAVGPADGWSAEALWRAQLKLSMGKMTLPHELARVVLAEQVYRALTILAGHPYHGGH